MQVCWALLAVLVFVFVLLPGSFGVQAALRNSNSTALQRAWPPMGAAPRSGGAATTSNAAFRRQQQHGPGHSPYIPALIPVTGMYTLQGKSRTTRALGTLILGFISS